MSIPVLYCSNGQIHYDETLPHDSRTIEFEHFLWSLGWAVNIETHKGYKGNLTTNLCEIAPYYSDLFCEVIFITPQICRDKTDLVRRGSKDSLMIPGISFTSISSDVENSSENIFDGRSSSKVRQRSYSVGSLPKKSVYHKVFQCEPVTIIWVHDGSSVTSIVESLQPTVQIFLVVYPQPASPAMYTFKLITFGLPLDDQLVFFNLIKAGGSLTKWNDNQSAMPWSSGSTYGNKGIYFNTNIKKYTPKAHFSSSAAD